MPASNGETRSAIPKLLSDDRLMKFEVGRRQSAVLARQVGTRRSRCRSLQPLSPRRAAQEQGRLRLHLAHDRNDHRDERTSRRGRAAWRVVSGIERREDSQTTDRREPTRCGRRSACEPVLWHRHSRCDSRVQKGKDRQDGAVHRCQSGIRRCQDSKTD